MDQELPEAAAYAPGRRLVCTLQRAPVFSVKMWLKSKIRRRQSTGESSWSDLKRRSLRLFLKRSPQQEEEEDDE